MRTSNRRNEGAIARREAWQIAEQETLLGIFRLAKLNPNTCT